MRVHIFLILCSLIVFCNCEKENTTPSNKDDGKINVDNKIRVVGQVKYDCSEVPPETVKVTIGRDHNGPITSVDTDSDGYYAFDFIDVRELTPEQANYVNTIGWIDDYWVGSLNSQYFEFYVPNPSSKNLTSYLSDTIDFQIKRKNKVNITVEIEIPSSEGPNYVEFDKCKTWSPYSENCQEFYQNVLPDYLYGAGYYYFGYTVYNGASVVHYDDSVYVSCFSDASYTILR